MPNAFTVWSQSGAWYAFADVASGAVVSGTIASGNVGNAHIISGGLLSGAIGSGQLWTFHLASGAQINKAQEVEVLSRSGLGNWGLPSAEIISGVRAVAVNQSGQLVIAMAGISGRMPAIGIAPGPTLSGQLLAVRSQGVLEFFSGLADFSGYIGKRIWVGRSGNVVAVSGSWASGGFLSGDIGQPLGTVIGSGQVMINVQPVMWSGGPYGIPTGGPY